MRSRVMYIEYKGDGLTGPRAGELIVIPAYAKR
jgi:hypothetical protein